MCYSYFWIALLKMKTLHLCLHRAHYPDYLGKMDEKYSTNSVHILSQRRVSFMIFNFCLFHKALQRKGTHTVYNLTVMQPLFNYYSIFHTSTNVFFLLFFSLQRAKTQDLLAIKESVQRCPKTHPWPIRSLVLLLGNQKGREGAN